MNCADHKKEARDGVIIIEDDRDVRMSFSGLFESIDLHVDSFGSVAEYREAALTDRPRCFVIDIRLPGQNGIEFFEGLVEKNIRVSAVFVTAYADVPLSVRAMKAGAIEFLVKPVRPQDILEAVYKGIEQDRARRRAQAELARLQQNFATLTAREREVMSLAVAGELNKRIGMRLGVSEATVKLHRGKVMRKMRASSFAELVRIGNSVLNCDTKRP